MILCPECGNPLDDAGFTNCNRSTGSECSRDRGMFLVRVEESMNKTSLETVHRMSENQMPQCFEPTREGMVALAKMLMAALQQNQVMAEQLRALRGPTH